MSIYGNNCLIISILLPPEVPGVGKAAARGGEEAETASMWESFLRSARLCVVCLEKESIYSTYVHIW